MVCILSICIASCASETKPKPINKAPSQKKQVAQKKKNSKKTSEKKANPYWTNLQKQLKLTPQKVNQLKGVKAKYDKQRKAAPKVNGKTNQAKLKAINTAQNKETKKILGDKLYAQKAAFDKKWQQQQKKNKAAKKKKK